MNRKTFLRGVGGSAVLAAVASGRLLARDPANEAAEVALPENDDPAFWSLVAGQYRITPGLRYFNTGGLGPAPLPVRRAVHVVMEDLQDRVETGHGRLAEVRPVVAAFLGAAVEEVAFMRNATEGNGIIAAGLDLQAGDEVIMESHAHPGGSFPWLALAQRKGIKVRVFEPDAATPEELLARIEAVASPRTRVVQVSHVTAPTGILMPVAELTKLCRARGWWFHVDGAQTLGMFPFSLPELGPDSYAGSGHKWLGAPHETGVLYVRRERLAEVAPPLVGAYSGDLPGGLPGELELNQTSLKFEYGTRNAAIIVGVGAAIAWQNTVGREYLAHRGFGLAERLRRGLGRLPDVEVISPQHPALRAPMVTIRTPRIAHGALFGRLLGEYKMRCRPVTEQGLNAVRVSTHLFNSPAEVDALLDALGEILRTT